MPCLTLHSVSLTKVQVRMIETPKSWNEHYCYEHIHIYIYLLNILLHWAHRRNIRHNVLHLLGHVAIDNKADLHPMCDWDVRSNYLNVNYTHAAYWFDQITSRQVFLSFFFSLALFNLALLQSVSVWFIMQQGDHNT